MGPAARMLGTRLVVPFYSQVAFVSASDAGGWPVDWTEPHLWCTGRTGVAVATIDDLDGDVQVAAWAGEFEPTGHELLTVASVVLPDGMAYVGNTIADDNWLLVELPAGERHVEVYTDGRSGPRSARSVVFVVHES